MLLNNTTQKKRSTGFIFLLLFQCGQTPKGAWPRKENSGRTLVVNLSLLAASQVKLISTKCKYIMVIKEDTEQHGAVEGPSIWDI